LSLLAGPDRITGVDGEQGLRLFAKRGCGWH